MPLQTIDVHPAALSQARSRYRLDIDGSRAIAVTSVVLFHAKLPLHSGLVGVDIFFVTSGYHDRLRRTVIPLDRSSNSRERSMMLGKGVHKASSFTRLISTRWCRQIIWSGR